MSRKPPVLSPQQRAVLLAYIEGRGPFEGLTTNGRIGRERTVYACQREGWIVDHSDRVGGTWVTRRAVTDAGRAAVATGEPCRKTA